MHVTAVATQNTDNYAFDFAAAARDGCKICSCRALPAATCEVSWYKSGRAEEKRGGKGTHHREYVLISLYQTLHEHRF